MVACVDLPPDDYDDEIALQLMQCCRCGRTGVAVYRETRRGRDPIGTHTLHELGEIEWKGLAALVDQCPHPRRRTCACPTHRRLGIQGGDGMWNVEKAVPGASRHGVRIDPLGAGLFGLRRR
jgi:hypothetical protein